MPAEIDPSAHRFHQLTPGQFFRFVPGYTVYELTAAGAYRSLTSGDEHHQAAGWDAPVTPCGRRTLPRT